MMRACGVYHEYRGGDNEYRGLCSVPWGYSSNKRFRFIGVHDIPQHTLYRVILTCWNWLSLQKLWTFKVASEGRSATNRK